MKGTLKAIFFDAGNTLLSVYPSVGIINAEVAGQFGVKLAPEEIEQSFKELWTQTKSFVSNDGHRLSYERERDWWKHLVGQIFRDHLSPMNFDEFFDHLYRRFADVDCWRLFEDVSGVLSQLRQQGFRLAIISNWGPQLPVLCDQLNISSFFEKVVVSAIVGYEKPHPRIFEFALENTGLTPQDVLYIGDDPYLDYQASRNIGMHALQIDRFNRFPDHPDRIVSLVELLDKV